MASMTTSPPRPQDFVPTPIASIIVFVFVGVFFLVGLIARCLALNQSSNRNLQNLDLVIYRAPPRLAVPNKSKQLDSLDLSPINSQEQRLSSSIDDPTSLNRIQRGAKNF